MLSQALPSHCSPSALRSSGTSAHISHHSAFHKAAVCTKSLTQVLQKKTQFWFYCLCLYSMYCFMQKLPAAEWISEPPAWACARTTFIFKVLLITSQPFSSSYYNFYIFCTMWNWALSQLSLMWFFPKGRTQQLLWHLLWKGVMDSRENLTVALQDALPHVSMWFFFVSLPVKDCWEVFLCWKYKALMGRVVLKLTKSHYI